MTERMTHKGILRGDARSGGRKPVVTLRETKRHWISADGTKYKKGLGWPVGGGSWPMWTLDIESIRPLEGS